MNSKTVKKLRKIATVYGVDFKDVERSYKKLGDDFIKKYEDRGGLENYGKIRNEVRKAEIKAYQEVTAEEAEKDKERKARELLNAERPQMVGTFDGAGRPLKMGKNLKRFMEGRDVKSTDSSAVISD